MRHQHPHLAWVLPRVGTAACLEAAARPAGDCPGVLRVAELGCGADRCGPSTPTCGPRTVASDTWFQRRFPPPKGGDPRRRVPWGPHPRALFRLETF